MKNNRKGFTLAELLIVIAIIAILIAIAIPVFSGQLDNAKLQADHSNLRSAYALVQTANLVGTDDTGIAKNAKYCTDGKFGSGTAVKIQAVDSSGNSLHNPTSKDSCGTCVVNCAGYKDFIYVIGEKGSWTLSNASAS